MTCCTQQGSGLVQYLTELLRHHRDLAANPALWMPFAEQER
jgi:hypothetical protein